MQHDSGRWGPLLAENPNDPDKPLRLARLADVVRHCEADMPLRVAIERVLQRLDTLKGLPLYELKPGCWADPITETLPVWRPGRAGQAARSEPIRPNSFGATSEWMAELRPSHNFRMDERFRAIPAVPPVIELRGLSDALPWLRSCWDKITDPAALDAWKGKPQRQGRLAILATDAAELFGYGVEVKPAPAAVVPLRPDAARVDSEQLPQSVQAPALHLAQPEPGLPTAPAADTEDLPTRRRRAVAMLRELEGQGLKGIRLQVADAFDISQRTVGKWLEAVEKEEQEARKAAALTAGMARLTAF